MTDPIFFLHHGQIDRLWWLWQQEDPVARNFDFSGIRILPSGETSPIGAGLNDTLPMNGLALDISVSKVMTTETKLLHYHY